MSDRKSDLTDEEMEAVVQARRDREVAAAIKEVEDASDERSAKILGGGLMLLGAVTIAVPILFTGTITVIPALSGLAIAILGGLVRDPKTFKSIATRAIDALPGGKN